MKNYTPFLIGKEGQKRGLKGLFLGQRTLQRHFTATQKNGPYKIMWIEATQLTKIRCYPCVIEDKEHDVLYAYRTDAGERIEETNDEMMELWRSIVSADNIRTEWDVVEQEKRKFMREYVEYQDTMDAREIKKFKEESEAERKHRWELLAAERKAADERRAAKEGDVPMVSENAAQDETQKDEIKQDEEQ